MNKVISNRIAIVDGQQTALAGCSNTVCQKNCLRMDKMLSCKADHNVKSAPECRYFIAA